MNGFPHHCFVILGATLFLLGSDIVSAEDFPRTGAVYNAKDVRELKYKCNMVDESTIDCDLIEMGVRKESNSADLESKLKAAREEFRSGVKMPADQCNMFATLVDIIEGRQRAPRQEGFSELTPAAKQDSLALGKAGLEFCKRPTEENYLTIIRLTHQKETRTCLVFSTSAKERYRLVDDPGIWVAKSEPEGSCGIVQLSRFEPETMKNSNYTFWKYTSRKAITNPQGTFFPGVACKDLDQEEYLYDWRSNDRYLSCDYIKFSPR
ncbi:hypothetical protein [Pseudomonas sp. D(2018)]|uniref:hypothetical protein n=1 Tax=Pseudomonas sp. D(2018) TaxID=2502238 RepID=UPI0010F698E4|nr:hypothetical protein [Pseudomonas sp. D(2018)]